MLAAVGKRRRRRERGRVKGKKAPDINIVRLIATSGTLLPWHRNRIREREEGTQVGWGGGKSKEENTRSNVRKERVVSVVMSRNLLVIFNQFRSE